MTPPPELEWASHWATSPHIETPARQIAEHAASDIRIGVAAGDFLLCSRPHSGLGVVTIASQRDPERLKTESRKLATRRQRPSPIGPKISRKRCKVWAYCGQRPHQDHPRIALQACDLRKFGGAEGIPYWLG